MKIFFDNVDFRSSSGPNSFGSKLARAFIQMGHQVVDKEPDVQLSFISISRKLAPTILRLDGIYFNSEQDWKALNSPINKSYEAADAIIVQSIFNHRLVDRYFGRKDNVHVVGNGTCLDIIEKIQPANISGLPREKVWFCASSWRPHKRLSDNIRYFKQFAPHDAILLVAGNNAPDNIQDDRVKYIGNLNWDQLISVMKASSHFIHLAWLDHCPNVVVDARASGCRIVCSSSGGTEEIAGTNSTVIEEDVWDFKPIKLYEPPSLDFSRSRNGLNYGSDIDILEVAKKYLKIITEEL